MSSERNSGIVSPILGGKGRLRKNQPSLLRGRNALPQGERHDGVSHPFFGLITVAAGTSLAIGLVPVDFAPQGALFKSALAMTLGLTMAPAFAVIQNWRSLFRAEHVLAVAPVYWLLLDLLQGRYEIELARRYDVINSFLGIGLFAAGIWLAALHHPWRLPGILNRAGSSRLDAGACLTITIACFALGIFYFAFKSDFDVLAMLRGLLAKRDESPWSRDNPYGGW